MKSDLFIIGVMVVGCGVFAFTQILQKAQTRLEPSLLAELTAKGKGTWTEFLLPLAPTFVAYLLVTRFPRHQAAIAIPAILLSAVLVFLQYRAARKRVASVDLPPEFLAERRKANIVLVATLVVGMGMVYVAKAT